MNWGTSSWLKVQEVSILPVHTPSSICFAFVNMPVQMSSSARSSKYCLTIASVHANTLFAEDDLVSFLLEKDKHFQNVTKMICLAFPQLRTFSHCLKSIDMPEVLCIAYSNVLKHTLCHEYIWLLQHEQQLAWNNFFLLRNRTKPCSSMPLKILQSHLLLFVVMLVAWSQIARDSSDQDGEAGFTKSKKHYLYQFILINLMK